MSNWRCDYCNGLWDGREIYITLNQFLQCNSICRLCIRDKVNYINLADRTKRLAYKPGDMTVFDDWEADTINTETTEVELVGTHLPRSEYPLFVLQHKLGNGWRDIYEYQFFDSVHRRYLDLSCCATQKAPLRIIARFN
jgi:hypothetical protein